MYVCRTAAMIKSGKVPDVSMRRVPEQLQEGPGEGSAEDPVQDGHQPAVLLPWRADL